MDAEVEDIFSDSLETLYGYTPITHGSGGSSLIYTIPDPLRIRPPSWSCSKNAEVKKPLPQALTLITPETRSSNWSLHASSIWVSSLYIADHLADLHIDRHIEVADRDNPLRILELGAGAGLPGILLAKVYDDILVTTSDYPDEDLVRTLEDNVKRNGVSERCRVVPYAWGSDPSSLLNTVPSTGFEKGPAHFDVIVAADTLWNPDLHTAFLSTLQSTLLDSPHSRIYLAAGLHTGRYTLQAFINIVPEFGLRIEEVREREVKGLESRDWDVSRAEFENELERRRWVIWMELKREGGEDAAFTRR